MSECGKYPYEDQIGSEVGKYTVPAGTALILKEPRYECRVHGDVGRYAMLSDIPNYEIRLCLKCYLEKLKEIGVCEVKQIN